MKNLGSVLILMGTTVCATPLWAQDYPVRTIRLVVPFTPGGGVDTVARTMAPKMSEALGQSIVIDNRAGAGSNIGTEAVAKATPDGYTLLINSSAIAINPSLYKKLSYDPLTDLAPVSMASEVPFVFVTSPKLPANSVPEVIALAKKAKTPLSYASAGMGNSTHLAMELVKMMTGTNMLHVPYQSTAQKNADVVNGRVDMMFTAPPSVAAFIQSNRMRALAVSGAKRSSVLPDLPTLSEAGIRGYDFASWNAVFAPARTPRAIIDRLHGEMVKAMANKDVRDRLVKIGADPATSSPEELAAYLKAEISKYAKLVAATGMKVE